VYMQYMSRCHQTSTQLFSPTLADAAAAYTHTREHASPSLICCWAHAAKAVRTVSKTWPAARSLWGEDSTTLTGLPGVGRQFSFFGRFRIDFFCCLPIITTIRGAKQGRFLPMRAPGNYAVWKAAFLRTLQLA
jgi:hypothetical protein